MLEKCELVWDILCYSDCLELEVSQTFEGLVRKR